MKEKEVKRMAIKEGEIYRCSDPECGCEIRVIKGAAEGKGDDRTLCCCSGGCDCEGEMQKVE